jgi:hypothetical protein
MLASLYRDNEEAAHTRRPSTAVGVGVDLNMRTSFASCWSYAAPAWYHPVVYENSDSWLVQAALPYGEIVHLLLLSLHIS